MAWHNTCRSYAVFARFGLSVAFVCLPPCLRLWWGAAEAAASDHPVVVRQPLARTIEQLACPRRSANVMFCLRLCNLKVDRECSAAWRGAADLCHLRCTCLRGSASVLLVVRNFVVLGSDRAHAVLSYVRVRAEFVTPCSAVAWRASALSPWLVARPRSMTHTSAMLSPRLSNSVPCAAR